MRELARVLRHAIDVLRASVPNADGLRDSEAGEKWRGWLGTDLPWRSRGISEDEWFFTTTLCGTMNLAGQRTHIRAFFPRFVGACDAQVARCTLELLAPWKLRSPWMKTRLTKMAGLLRRRAITMADYVRELRAIESGATASSPMPALDRLSSDLDAVQAKTLGLFVRDCVIGNCFPIDSRVQGSLQRFGIACRRAGPRELLPRARREPETDRSPLLRRVGGRVLRRVNLPFSIGPPRCRGPMENRSPSVLESDLRLRVWTILSMPNDEQSPASRMATALVLMEGGVELRRQKLRRAHPEASEAEVAAMLEEWLRDTAPILGCVATPWDEARHGRLR